jgi:hypothetical protein
MARGKYRAAHAARQRAAVAELAAQLAEEVAGEQTRVRGADDRARQRRLAHDRLATERAQLTEQLADQTQQLRQVADELTGLIRELETSGDQVMAGWRRCEEKLAHRLGGQAALRSLLRGLPTIVLPEGGHRTPNAVARARAATRGQRLAADVDLAYAPITWYAPWLPEPLRTIGLEMRQYAPLGVRGIRTGRVAERVRNVPEELKDAVRHFADDLDTVSASTVDDPHPLALVAWHTPPWLAPGELDDPDTHRIAPALGLDLDAEPEPPPADEEQEGHPPAASQDWQDWQEEWRRDLGLVARTGRLTTPWAPRPVFPRPSDALALRHWYRAVAAASWCHSAQTLALVTHAVDGDWKQATLPAARRSARTWESVGTAFTDAAMYWLPCGHTAAHADSEPLDTDAALDLRLPYDAVFLAFADPILLPPIDNNPGSEHYQRIRRSAAARPGPDTDPCSLTWRTVMENNLTSAAEAESRQTTFAAVPSLLRYHGAAVEGLLLLAEPDGHPLDQFAWCLALTDPETGDILGRDIIIANRSRTTYRTLIDNMLAVVAWADWHHDLHAEPAAGPPAGHDASWEHAAGITAGLHVLATRRSPHATGRNPHEDTGRQLRPHRRRGYWRRQHHGPGNRNIKWIRIPPTIVNAHRGPLGWQVYQLPPAV